MVEVKSYAEALMMFHETPKDYAAGEVIFKQGDLGTTMYIVREGKVELRKGDTLLETLGPGAVFGEMALVDPAPRSASAVAGAGAGCKLVAMDEATFKQLVPRVPGFALELLRTVVRRLRGELAKG